MNKLLAAIVLTLFAAAVFAQAQPATPAMPEQRAADKSLPPSFKQTATPARHGDTGVIAPIDSKPPQKAVAPLDSKPAQKAVAPLDSKPAKRVDPAVAAKGEAKK